MSQNVQYLDDKQAPTSGVAFEIVPWLLMIFVRTSFFHTLSNTEYLDPDTFLRFSGDTYIYITFFFCLGRRKCSR